jgi:hypothetical protein
MTTSLRVPLLLCAAAACAQLTNFQLGRSSPTATASPSASPAASPSASPASPATAVASGGAFCGKHSYGKRTAKELHAWFDDPDKGRHEMSFLIKLHQALCSADTPAADRAEIAQMRKTVLGELGLTEADTQDIAKLLDLDFNAKLPGYLEYIVVEPPSVPGEARASSTSPVDQLYVLVSTNNWFYKTRWLVDAWGDTMTESARAAYINVCLHGASNGKPSEKALAYAWCSDDVHHFDRAKFNGELAALPPDVRFTAKVELARLMKKVAAFESEIAKDPKLAKIAIEMPRKIGDDWRKFAHANHALIDHVRSIELAWVDHEGEAPADCRATLAGDWKRAVSAVKVEKTSAPSLGVAASSRAAYLASVGMARCTSKMPGFTGLAAMVEESLDHVPLARGPRTEAFEAAVAELAKGTTAKVDVPRMESVDVSFLPMQQSNGHSARFWAHTVASMERHGDKIKFHFKKEKVDYAVCTREEPTGNWIIHGDRLERETHCVSLRSASTMEAVEPIEMPADLTGWVRPGNAIVIGTAEFPIEIWSDVHQTKLIGLYGTNRG